MYLLLQKGEDIGGGTRRKKGTQEKRGYAKKEDTRRSRIGSVGIWKSKGERNKRSIRQNTYYRMPE